MDFFFADDARQRNPSRRATGELLAIGGLHVPSTQVGLLEKAIQAHCESIGFPREEQFKWSPTKAEKFQRERLNDVKRIEFFERLLGLAKEHQATATVVIADKTKNVARRKSKNHEEDITALFLERCDWSLRGAGTNGLLVVATPSGGTRDHNKFVADALQIIRSGTEYMDLKSLPLGIVLAPSRQMRLLQLADIVCSCSVARVGGESNFSPRVFEVLRPLFRRDGSRTGGIGLKIHPDFNYANLYYWLLNDSHWWKGNTGVPLPVSTVSFFKDAGEAASGPVAGS